MDTTYAKSSNGNIVKAHRGMIKEHPFFCLGCNERLYAATGEKNKAHFRHNKIKGHKGCNSSESYVHWVTKELFAEHYKKCTKFFLSIEVRQKCLHDNCEYISEYIINLKDIYPHIKVEVSHAGVRPDCLLYNKTDKDKILFFEVLYTHQVSEEKIKLGYPIMEVKVVNETNIDEICKVGGFTTKEKTFKFLHSNSQDYYKIILYNSQNLIPKSVRTFNCKDKCIIEKKEAEEKREREKKLNKEQNTKKTPPIPREEQEKKAHISKKTKPIKDIKAIKYISNKVNKRTAYAMEKEIPSIIGQSYDNYMLYYYKHKDKVLQYDKLYILENKNSFMFISYKNEYFGVIKYETIWHIFSSNHTSKTDNDISFIESTKDGDLVGTIIEKISDSF